MCTPVSSLLSSQITVVPRGFFSGELLKCFRVELYILFLSFTVFSIKHLLMKVTVSMIIFSDFRMTNGNVVLLGCLTPS